LTAALVIENLTYTYPSFEEGSVAAPVLREINLRVRRGEVLGVMGATGAGKSTLCLALAGIVPHSTGGVFGGEVRVAGLNTKTERVADLAQKVGLVFQDPETQLFNMTVEDEVAFGPESLGLPREEIERRITWALSVVRMTDYRSHSPFHLSGGQKQRVALAALLAMRPEILVLDEPTAWLDPLGKREIVATLLELKQTYGLTIVIVEQDAEVLAALVDRIVVLADGQMAYDGSPHAIFARPEQLRALGLDLPQLATLAALFRERQSRAYDFYTLDQARLALASAG